MMSSSVVVGLISLVVIVVGWWVLARFWPRPVLRQPVLPEPERRIRELANVAEDASPPDLATLAAALQAREAKETRIIPGAEAVIRFANPEQPRQTPIAYLYLHGLSACRQETAPVTETLATQDQSNAVYARIAGHGMGDQAMGEVDAGTWLASVWDFWCMASAAGKEVVIVATSTGATSATWLVEQPGVQAHVRAMLFLSPNFKVRNPLAFLLTWYGVEHWLPQVVSPERRWHSQDPRQSQYWSTNYGNQALIQMQLLINAVKHSPVEAIRVPLMVQISRDDPVVEPTAARQVYERWGGFPKEFRWVVVPPGESPHIIVGDIMAPHRNDEIIGAFRRFLDMLPD